MSLLHSIQQRHNALEIARSPQGVGIIDYTAHGDKVASRHIMIYKSLTDFFLAVNHKTKWNAVLVKCSYNKEDVTSKYKAWLGDIPF
jgi:hypothetical protein